ncbi:MAG TPA: DUF2764 family protein [Candidatus Cloacimonadota bacterium]|nr:DUF2764 family protein [Candidatus Cloacimonadota bacterium]
MQYYYFITGLPNLGLDDNKLSYDPAQFLEDAANHLTKKDLGLLKLLHIPLEISHLLKCFYPEARLPETDSLHPAGFYEDFLAFLKQKLENPDTTLPARFKELPDFMEELVLELLKKEDLPSHAKADHSFLNAFYTSACSHSNEFIAKWFSLDRDLRNILIALNGRAHQMPFQDYLIGDNELANGLAKSQAADFGLGKEHSIYEAVWRIFDQNNLLYRERGYDVYRWKWIENQNFFQYFTIDRILGYYCKLRILARWTSLDTDAGKSVFYEALNTLQNSFSFPEEFKK